MAEFLTDKQFNKLVSGISSAFSRALAGGDTSAAAAVPKEIDEARRKVILDNIKSLKEYEELERKIKADAVERAAELIELGEEELTQKQRNLILAAEAVEEAREYYKVAKESTDITDEEVQNLKNKLKELIKIRKEKQKDREDEKNDDNKRRNRQSEINTELSFQADQILTRFAGIDNKTMSTAKTLKGLGSPVKAFKAGLGEASKKIQEAGLGSILMAKTFEKLKETASFIGKLSFEGVGEGFNLLGNVEKAAKRQDAFRLAARETNVLAGQQIEELGQKFMRLGQETDGTTEDFMRINKELFNTSNVFRDLKARNDETRESLERTAFTLQRRFMINVVDGAKVTDILGQSFGKTTPEIEEFEKILAASASTLGLDVKTVFADFAAEATNLSRFGLPDIQKEFLSLSVIAQKTGISINQVTGALEKFSTFEGALTAASKLNAVFNTTIDGMEIMEEFNLNGPVAALIKLREGLEQTGQSFSDLNFAEMRVFQESLGMNSLQLKSFTEVSVEELKKIQEETRGLSFAEAEKVLQKGRKEAELSAEKRLNFIDKSVTAMNKEGKQLDDINRSVMDSLNGMSESMNKLIQALNYVGDIIKVALVGGMIKFIGQTVMATRAAQVLAQTQAMTNVTTGLGTGAGAGGFLAGSAGGILGLAALGIGAGIMLEGSEFDIYEKEGGGSAMDRAGGIKERGGLPGFQSELNYSSMDQMAVVGEVPETIALRQQATTIPAGASVKQIAAGPSNINLTVNLVTREGEILETTNIATAVDEKEMNKAITTYLNSKLNLGRRG